MKKLVILLFGASVLTFSGISSAATFNLWLEPADELGTPVLTRTDDGVTAEFDGYITSDPGTQLPAFLDGGAGVGVCSGLPALCAGSEDDHVNAPLEVLRVTLTSGWQEVSGLRFTAADHTSIDVTQSLGYSVDGSAFSQITFGALGLLTLQGTVFEFLALPAIADISQNFYLKRFVTANAIPVPAAVWLFGTAMLGLFGLRRRTKTEALTA